MARSDSLWLDSDVILDWLANRKPWAAAATEIIERAILGEWALCFSPLTLANVHYIYRKHSGNAESLDAITTLARIGSIATMDSGHVSQALASGHSDFEDELQIASASTLPGSHRHHHPQPHGLFSQPGPRIDRPRLDSTTPKPSDPGLKHLPTSALAPSFIIQNSPLPLPPISNLKSPISFPNLPMVLPLTSRAARRVRRPRQCVLVGTPSRTDPVDPEA